MILNQVADKLAGWLAEGANRAFAALLPSFIGGMMAGGYQYSGWMTVFFFSVMYLAVCVVNRAVRYRTYRYLNVNTGHFYAGGRMYYRANIDGPLYRAELKKTKGYDSLTGALVAPEFEYFSVGGHFLGFSESTLVGVSPVKRVSPTALPQGLVILFDGETVSGVGWRYDNCLVTARHVMDNTSTLWVQGAKGRVQVNASFKSPPVDNYEHTGGDISSADLSQTVWSQIGCKALKRNTLSNRGSGKVIVYGADSEGFYEASGDMIADGLEQKKRGTISYKVNTLPGFSGSPVLIRTPSGGLSVVGMHVCGDYTKNNRNHGVCSSALSLHLNGTVSHGSKLTVESILSESPLPGDRQEIFDDWDDLSLERMYNDKRFWEDEDDFVRARVHGFEGDEDGSYEYDDRAPIDYNEKTDVKHIPKDPEGFDFLSPPSETKRERIARQTTYKQTPEAATMQQYVSAVKSVAPEFAPVLTGFLAGEKVWHSSTDVEGAFKQPSAKKVEAKPADIERLFRKLFQGDHTAFVEAAGYTYESLVDARHSSVVDPFGEFRNYRDHTRGLIDKTKKTGEVFPTKDGRPFFRHIGRSKSAMKKKARSEPLGTSDEDKLFLDSIGIKDCFFFPPNDEKSIKASMKAQAAKQQSHRGLPEFECMMDAWVQAMRLNVGETLELKYGSQGLEKVFASFDDTSSGWTRRYRNLSKRNYVAKHAVQLAQLGFGRLLARASMLDSLPSMTPEEMVYLGLRDPVELFVKEEPHNEKKKTTETWRLICNISLADCVAQAYLGDGLNKQQIRDYQTGFLVSHTCGMGHHDEGIQRLGEHIEKLFPNGRVVSTDASGWDMSVSRDAIMADAMQRCLRASTCLDPQQAVGTAMAIIADKLIMSAHMFVSGLDVWSVEVYGITASGLPDTTTQNSFMRGLGAMLAGSRTVMTAGDDLLSSSPLDEEILGHQGTITKEGLEVSNWKLGETISFTSHSYKRSDVGKWSAKFENVSKCLHRLLLTGNPTADQLGGVAFAMRNDDDQLKQLGELCVAKGWELPDKSNWSQNGEMCA